MEINFNPCRTIIHSLQIKQRRLENQLTWKIFSSQLNIRWLEDSKIQLMFTSWPLGHQKNKREVLVSF